MYQYDSSRIGMARREAIQALDDYACTVAEQCGLFKVTASTFHRYADGVRLRRRPSKAFTPGCQLVIYAPLPGDDVDDEAPMPPADCLEIATIALIRSRSRFTVEEIVTALRTSQSAVYRQKKAFKDRLGRPGEVENRWLRRHLPSHLTDHKSRAELARDAERRARCWVTRARNMKG